jgi:hypothetical protein
MRQQTSPAVEMDGWEVVYLHDLLRRQCTPRSVRALAVAIRVDPDPLPDTFRVGLAQMLRKLRNLNREQLESLLDQIRPLPTIEHDEQVASANRTGPDEAMDEGEAKGCADIHATCVRTTDIDLDQRSDV